MLKTKPFKYQEKGINKLHKVGGRMLVADEMGLGKTLQALAYSDEIQRTGPIIVVCPAHLKYNWEREAAKHIAMRAEVLESKTPRRGRPRDPAPMYIINFDVLKFWVPWLRRLRPSIVIIDECQYIKNRAAQRTRATMRLCRRIGRVIGLSGTPLTNRPAELWPILHIIRPDLFPEFFSFAHRYCGPKKRRWGWEFKGATRLDELHNILKTECMIRRLKKDVLKQLPQHSNHIELIPIKMKEYKFAFRDFIGWLKTRVTDRGRIKRASRVEAMAKIGYLSRLVAELKMDYVVQWIETALENTDGKLIVFAIHKKIIATLEAAFRSISVRIDGSVTGRDRQSAIDKFTNNPKARLCLAQLRAAGTGWNGTVAQTSVFVELGDQPAEHSQASARMDRIGQTRKNKSYYLIAKGTLEERKCAMLQRKQGVLDKTLDGKQQAGSMELHDLLIQELWREGN